MLNFEIFTFSFQIVFGLYLTHFINGRGSSGGGGDGGGQKKWQWVAAVVVLAVVKKISTICTITQKLSVYKLI